jgi:hypothetical protein
VLLSFAAGRSLNDLRVQWLSAATLALVTRGTVTDPQDGVTYDPEAALRRATSKHPLRAHSTRARSTSLCTRGLLRRNSLAIPSMATTITRTAMLPEASETAYGDDESIQKIEQHIATHLPGPSSVWHEIASDIVHIDVHLIGPTPTRNHHTLITMGMSYLPMTTPEEWADYRFAELMLCLPPEWPLDDKALKDDANYWPIKWLKYLARFPHGNHTWFKSGHSIANGNPAKPFHRSTKLCGSVFLMPRTLPEAFHRLSVDADKTIHFLAVVPTYAEETQLKLDHGAEALEERFTAAGITELLNPKRPNVCPRPNRFWPRVPWLS